MPNVTREYMLTHPVDERPFEEQAGDLLSSLGPDGPHLLVPANSQEYLDFVTGFYVYDSDFERVISIGDTAEFSDLLDDEDNEYSVSMLTAVSIYSGGVVLFNDSQGEVWNFIRPLTNRSDTDIRLAQEEVDRLTADLANARAKLEALQKSV